jgi:hypothetical protein
MKRQSLVFACALAAAALSTAVGRASTIDDAATRVVVPYVAWDGTTDTTVFVTNHESRDVKVNVIYVGESTGPAPGRRTCNSVLLPAAQLSRIDVLTACGLTRPTGAGMVVLVEDDAGIARLSARARVGIFSPVSGSPLQVLTVQGLPLSALDTTDNVHAAYGLRQVPAPAPAVITDCFFGTFTDASGAGGALVNFALVDAAGHTLGSKVFAVRPSSVPYRTCSRPWAAPVTTRARGWSSGSPGAATPWSATVSRPRRARTGATARSRWSSRRWTTRWTRPAAASSPRWGGRASALSSC